MALAGMTAMIDGVFAVPFGIVLMGLTLQSPPWIGHNLKNGGLGVKKDYADR